MGRKCNKNPSKKFQITTSEQVYKHLESLVDTGLYGSSVPEAAEELICESLRSDLKKTRMEALNGKSKG